MTETIRYSEELWPFHFFSVSITIWLSAWLLPTQTKYYTTIKLVSQEISWRTIFSLLNDKNLIGFDIGVVAGVVAGDTLKKVW